MVCHPHSEELAHRAAGSRSSPVRDVPPLVGGAAARCRILRTALAHRVGRRWVLLVAAGGAGRGVRPRRRATQRAVSSSPVQRRAQHPACRHRRAEGEVLAGNHQWHGVVPGVLGTKRWLRPRRPTDARHSRWRPLRRHWPESVDQPGDGGRVLHPARAHRPRRSEAQGHHLPVDGYEVTGYRGADHPSGHRPERVL
ncbi:unannotated protein [freshwater metagenome]|uniref:Unannotated protein n=1 Tax=freshwater metagenome TaxID=449393 RepID=A0A6J7A2T0_9ZZZZ